MQVGRLLRGFSPVGGALNPPAAPSLNVQDRTFGNGGDAFVTGSTAGSSNAVYYASLSFGVINWTLAGTITGDGSVPINVNPGDYLVKVVSTLNGVDVTGQVAWAEFTDPDQGQIYDLADGTGIHVTVSGLDPNAVNTIQVRDATQDNWRDVVTVTGNQSLTVTVGPGTNQIVVGRAYYVRTQSVYQSQTAYTQQRLVTPTDGYPNPTFEMLTALKHNLITLDLPRIGGNAFVVMDPRPLTALPSAPCLFLFQSRPDVVSPADNRTTFIDSILTVQIADVIDGDWMSPTEWWLFVRNKIIDELNRFATDTFGPTSSGRRWRVEPGPLMAAGEPDEYQWRAQEIYLHADLERLIGGN